MINVVEVNFFKKYLKRINYEVKTLTKSIVCYVYILAIKQKKFTPIEKKNFWMRLNYWEKQINRYAKF